MSANCLQSSSPIADGMQEDNAVFSAQLASEARKQRHVCMQQQLQLVTSTAGSESLQEQAVSKQLCRLFKM